MAWTTPKTWTTGELVTAAMLNEQVRDNEVWLKDQFHVSTGHDHDGSDSKVIPWTNMPVAEQVTWITSADAVNTSYEGQSARPTPMLYAEGPYSDTYEMLFNFRVPYQMAGQAVHVKEIKFYGYTASNLPYFDAVYLRHSDLTNGAPLYVDDVTYATDLGNGSSGDFNATIFSGDLTLTDFPHNLVVKCAGGGQYGDYRVYGFRVVWEY